MKNKLNAEIIAIGSELLLPEATETNSSLIARMLFSLGVQVQFKTVVGDFEKDIGRAVQTALKRARWIILSGGLGPTEDDVTRRGVASVLGKPLAFNKKVSGQLQKKFKARGRLFLKIHERQAWFPQKAILIPNKTGIAPGFILKEKDSFLISLPGVPSEMRQMIESTVSPFIKKKRGAESTLFIKRYKTFGISESAVNEALKDLMGAPGVTFGLLAKKTGVEVSILIKEETPQEIKKALREIEARIKERLESFIYGENDETLEGVVGRQLKNKKKTLAVAESCTGGLLCHRITNVPGSSAYFNSSAVTYSNEAKVKQLGVPFRLIKKYGAVSAKVAMAMAEGIRKTSRSDFGLAVTGIAGPGGATAHKPVGLVYFGLADQKGLCFEEARYTSDRETFKWFASSKALDMMRLRLL
ncbi:MAG: competence/damage-inducible protein A [Nitrospirae bacterium]|nr:competence/damage-inducible protein A [Nitrospirota bacterium]MBI3604920.1 competence/damage-inducible protein A [Nitrospirota bacterium]